MSNSHDETEHLNDTATVGARPRIRTIAFDGETFDGLKTAQRRLEQRLRRDTNNSETIRYLIHTHPAADPATLW
ncbi:hypothetical protein [Oleiagrimonas sp. C23AA]|uniref:hypothetical protein n=1 Tax=Oleiagrimonas sp. C23AA TaxID=2719047 RepID=UPI00141DD8A7|nr:hypothetical protein [Oleiagrimonas sp. C23AA]NII11550.1 hypothetical protein [Oleiagrimonas sp. C23AA]